jgi:hypothetical protein
MNFRIFLLFPLFFFSCSQNSLITQTQVLGRQELASYNVGTPDPALSIPQVGQRLLVHWKLQKEYLFYNDLHLDVQIRFFNREMIAEKIPIRDRSGYYIYTLRDEDFCDKEGILTYKVDIIGDNCLIASRRHQLWVDLIDIGDKDCEE